MKFREWFLQEDLNATVTSVGNYLGQVEKAGFTLMVHQTAEETALRIIKTMDFDAGASIASTANVTTAASLTNWMRTIFMPAHAARANGDEETYRRLAVNQVTGVHKGSDAVLVMAMPNIQKWRSMRDIDDYLADLTLQGAINNPSIPNRFIIGFWRKDGQFFANGKFKPTMNLAQTSSGPPRTTSP